MKRPEGFDSTGRAPQPPQGRASERPVGRQATPKKQKATSPERAVPQREQRVAEQPAPQRATAMPRQPAASDVPTKRSLRKAARERRRVERAEMRRFTRKARRRRIVLAVVLGTIATLIGLVAVAVYSPILALREVRVDGTLRIDAAEVQAAVEQQLGTPLALLDEKKITEQLSVFPLIRSYVTEMVPPGTLLVHIVERQPVGTVRVGEILKLVDPAGVVVQETNDRIPGVPIFELGDAAVPSPAFDAVVAVMLSLPPDLAARVDVATARTEDDVTLTLAGVGQSVVWGNAEQSEKKATLLTALIANYGPDAAGQFDVSAPGNGIFRPTP